MLPISLLSFINWTIFFIYFFSFYWGVFNRIEILVVIVYYWIFNLFLNLFKSFIFLGKVYAGLRFGILSCRAADTFLLRLLVFSDSRAIDLFFNRWLLLFCYTPYKKIRCRIIFVKYCFLYFPEYSFDVVYIIFVRVYCERYFLVLNILFVWAQVT